MLSEYTNIKDRIDIRCKICGHKWNPIAESLVAKISCGCPKCAGNAVKDSSTFEEELKRGEPMVEYCVHRVHGTTYTNTMPQVDDSTSVNWQEFYMIVPKN